eukprot:XP_001695726.1 predicted protein [Chlamydomonas reinhardtii]
MNAPPGFLEFLLCVPWRKLSQLYPKSDSIDKLVSNLQVTDEERRKLVNTRIEPALMGSVLDFLYKEKHLDSVPPMLQLTPVNPLQPAGVQTLMLTLLCLQEDKSAPVVVRETVAAVLDGATPLHCAALRGNPAQVDHLLYCGADPTLMTAAGELPIELVPMCGDRSAGASTAAAAEGSAGGSSTGAAVRKCRCMGPHDQEVWECRSRLARSLIARRCFFSFGVGLFSWVKLMVFCLLCLLGYAGCYNSISRPTVERHIDTRRQQKVAAARARAHALVTRMRSEAETGHKHLEQAKRECLESAAFQKGPPDITQMRFTDPTKSPLPPPPQINQIHDINFHLQESGTSSTGEELASEKAFKCFVRSVHALQSLDLHGDTVPQVFAELVQAGGAESRETHVLEDEQADLYSCWAESVLLKFRGCTCPGCAALAIQAVRMAHIQATRLFGKVDRVKQTHADRWRAVGQALARVVYVHICLLLETEAQASPTRSLVWRAEQCLREWDRLEKAGLTQGAGVLDPRHVSALQLWAKTADSDLYLAEALHGQSLPPTKTLQEVVLGAVSYTEEGLPLLARPVNAEVVAGLEHALTLAGLPSPLLAHIVRSVVANASAELAAAARLRELVGGKAGGGGAAPGGAGAGGSGTADAVAALSDALRAAEPYRTRLGPEVDAALELRSKWTQRASAVEKLEGAVEEVRGYTLAQPLSFSTGAEGGAGPGAGSDAAAAAAASAPDLVEWDRRMKQLETAMNEAKDANVSVTKAKRLHKEMAAVAAAAEASRQLELVMSRRPSGPAQLKQALNKAESALSSLSGLGGPPVPGASDVLGPLVASARRRLDTERAAEALSKAAASYRSLADLARLEAAIYNAKKIGAEELDPESYRTSLELRAQLQEAARARSGLETALRNLQNQLRPEDAEALERALQDATKWEELLSGDTAKARKALEQWRSMTVSDAKLARLLREGASPAVLAKAIQEAAASGVKVQNAKRVLKLMQTLEAALGGTAVDGGAAERHAAIKSRLEAAEAGGVTAGPLPEAARQALARLEAEVAREALEAALKPHSDWAMAHRISVLREALDKAEGIVGSGKAEANGDTAPASKQANGSAGGKGGRGKRSSGGSSSASSAAGEASGSGGAAAAGPSPAPAGLVDESALTAVRELVQRARQVLAEDQAELARIERERQEAERARKEALERERLERLKQEQERQKREKAEAAERERLQAEKREKAKAEKTRQQQQAQQQAQQAAQQKASAAAAAAASDKSAAAVGKASMSAAVAAAVHTRGDSLDSLGEVVHKLNRDVIKALDLDMDVETSGSSDRGSVAVGGVAGGGGVLVSMAGTAGGVSRADGGSSFGRCGSGAAATTDGVADAVLTPSQRTSSIMSSIASADDVMLLQSGGGSGNAGPSAGAAPGAGGVSLSTVSNGLATSAATGADAAGLGQDAGAIGTAAGAGAASNKPPRFGFVDLGGASWGLDSPLLSNAAGAAGLFPSLQSNMVGAEFGSILSGGLAHKPGAGGAGGPDGWSTAGAGSALGFGGIGHHGGGSQGTPLHSSLDDSAALMAAVLARHQQQLQQQQQAAAAGAVGGMLMGGLTVNTGSMGVDANGLALLSQGALASPSNRSTVSTSNAANMHGLMQVRPQPGAASMMTGSAAGGGTTGRPSLQLAMPPSALAGQASADRASRAGFWTPPTFQGAGLDFTASADALGGLGVTGAGGGMDWQQQQQQPGLNVTGTTDLGGGLQMLHLPALSGLAGAPGSSLRGSLVGGVNAAAAPQAGGASGSRVCRFFLQGFCRDGERCRFAHTTALSPPTPGAAMGSAPSSAQAAAAAAANSAIGSFAFGAPGAEAFAPLGGGLGRNSTAGGGGEPMLRPGSVPGGGSMTSMANGLALLERAHRNSQIAAAAAQQQQLTALYGAGGAPPSPPSGRASVSGVSAAGGPPASTQQMVLALPDDLTFSPSSHPSTQGNGVLAPGHL